MMRLVEITRRLLAAGATLLVASLLAFVLLGGSPGGVTAPVSSPSGAEAAPSPDDQGATMASLLPVRYALWLGHALSGDLGHSAINARPVAELVLTALPATLELLVMAILLGVPLGCAGALGLFVLHHEPGRRDAMGAVAETIVGLVAAVPVLVWSLLLLLAGAIAALPVLGRLSPGLAWPSATGLLLLDAILAGSWTTLSSAVRYLLLPALALGVPLSLAVARLLHPALIEAWRQESVLWARLRGLSATQALLGLALPRALALAATRAGWQAGLLLGASIIVEVICAIPGLGALLTEAVRNGDRLVILGAALAYATLLLLARLAMKVPRQAAQTGRAA